MLIWSSRHSFLRLLRDELKDMYQEEIQDLVKAPRDLLEESRICSCSPQWISWGTEHCPLTIEPNKIIGQAPPKPHFWRLSPMNISWRPRNQPVVTIWVQRRQRIVFLLSWTVHVYIWDDAMAVTWENVRTTFCLENIFPRHKGITVAFPYRKSNILDNKLEFLGTKIAES